MRSAAEIANSYLAGQQSIFEVAKELYAHIASQSGLWEALKGAYGPLPVIYEVSDVADQLGFFVSKEVQWESEAYKSRQAKLAEAEARLAPDFQTACRAIVEHAKNSN
jgi:hypothetical protein